MGPELSIYVALGLMVSSLTVGTWVLARTARTRY